MRRSGPLRRGAPLGRTSKIAPGAVTARACKQCGLPVGTKRDNGYATPPQFCSQACMGAHNRRRVKLICASCGTTFERAAAWVRKSSGPTYCSRSCQGQGRVRPESTHSRGPGWRKLAEQIRDRDGRRCVRCDASEPPSRKLAVDHIVPWVLVKHDANGNHPDNLAALCLRCHGVKTTVTEPRMLRGDWLALSEFYGSKRASAAMTIVL